MDETNTGKDLYEELIYLAADLRAAVTDYAESVTDEKKIMKFAGVYDKWESGVKYEAGKILRYGVNLWDEIQLWKVIAEHISQSDWTPDIAGSLYYKIGFSDSGMPIWTRPNGAHDAYDLGDRVEHNGKYWESTYDGKNVWEPGVFGWKEIEYERNT